ncbi:MAG: zinc ribbon domain-containing protein [bacterium]|nr:zinc ribbon domain-containing protein [bacterium]
MPIYEYYCDSCAHTEEILQKVNELPPEECSECHKKGSLRKKVSQTSFQLKGGGWYSDLYASTKPESDNKSKDSKGKVNKSEPSTAESKSAEKSTAKVEPKTEVKATPKAASTTKA